MAQEVFLAQFQAGRIRFGNAGPECRYIGMVQLSKMGAWLLDGMRSALSVATGVHRRLVSYLAVSNNVLAAARARLLAVIFPDYRDPLFTARGDPQGGMTRNTVTNHAGDTM